MDRKFSMKNYSTLIKESICIMKTLNVIHKYAVNFTKETKRIKDHKSAKLPFFYKKCPFSLFVNSKTRTKTVVQGR